MAILHWKQGLLCDKYRICHVMAILHWKQGLLCDKYIFDAETIHNLLHNP